MVLYDVVLTKLSKRVSMSYDPLCVRYALYAFENTKKTNTRIGRHVLSSDVRLLVSVNDLRVYFQRTVSRSAERLLGVMSIIENRRKSSLPDIAQSLYYRHKTITTWNLCEFTGETIFSYKQRALYCNNTAE